MTETKAVESWWNENPFSYGTSGKGTDQVGSVSDEAMDLPYFDRLYAKFKQHGGVEKPWEDENYLLPGLVDYDNLKDKDVLDIATGPGLFLVEFVRAGARRAVGIDLTAYAVKHAKTHLGLRGLDAEVLQMDAQDLQFTDDSFDYVHAWGCVMHMPDTEKAISEIHRVLKPGGRALIYVYNRNSWTFWFNFVFLKGILMGQLLKYRFDLDRLSSRFADGASIGGSPLAKFYSKSALREMIIDAGFRNARYTIWSRPSEPEAWPSARLPLGKILPRSWRNYLSSKMGLALVAVVQK